MKNAHDMARDLKSALGRNEAIDFIAGRMKATKGKTTEYWTSVFVAMGSTKAKAPAKKPAKKPAAKPKAKGKATGGTASQKSKFVWEWLKKTEPTMELTHDATLYTPEQWAKKGHSAGENALFVIATEGPLYQLINGYMEFPEADKIVRDFETMLKRQGIWYDQHEAWNLVFYPK